MYDQQNDAGEALATAGHAIEAAGHALAAAGETVSAAADEAPQGDAQGSFVPLWSKDAPRGGRTVLNRMLKESGAVPLFLAQTFIQSLRDVGYDSTTSALCEHVDNAIGAGATEVRVLFRQTGKKGAYVVDVVVGDNGTGMAPPVLKAATAFGGSMRFDNRRGIGRFGMGMKTAGLALAPAMDIISWQEVGAFYRMTLDTVAIGRDRSNLIELADAEYLESLPSEVSQFFTQPMSWPKSAAEQEVLSPHGTRVTDALGPHGTIVYMPSCDRLSSRRAGTLADDATKTFAHVYRRAITAGLRLYVNNRVVEASDPTLSMTTARHARLPSMAEVAPRTSRLVAARKASIFPREGSALAYDVSIKVYALPIREWSKLPRKVQNEVGIFDDKQVSILRNDREVFAGANAKIMSRHSSSSWMRVEIDFPGELDEAFGVAANKQGVRPKDFVYEAIRKVIAEDLAAIRNDVEGVQAQNSVEKRGSGPTPAEMKAKEADPFIAERLETNLSETERGQLDENLRGLAVALRREGETSEEAFARVKESPYIITYKSDKWWPFFATENRFGRVILTVNTAHPFYARLYEPLMQLSARPADGAEGEAGEARGPNSDLITMLELMLLSMARSQSVIAQNGQDQADLLDGFRRSWSDAMKVQMAR